MTNRDLYLFIADLIAREQKTERSLADYLRCFLQLATAYRETPGLDAVTFAGLLERAFAAPLTDPAPSPAGASAFAVLADLLRRQVRDLADMADAGTLADEMRYFGANAPSGHRWYNFDPLTFIECAATSTFGGWREGDATARMFVPGQVAIFGENGGIHAVDPHSVEDPIEELGLLDWEQVAHFFEMGQIYE